MTPFNSQTANFKDLSWVTWLVTQVSKTVEAASWKRLGIGEKFLYNTLYIVVCSHCHIRVKCDLIQLHEEKGPRSFLGD